MVAAGEQNAVVLQRGTDTGVGSLEMGNLEIPTVSDGGGAAQEVEASAHEALYGEVGGRNDRGEVGGDGAVDGDGAAGGLHDPGLHILRLNALTCPALDVLGELGDNAAVEYACLEIVHEVFHGVGIHLFFVPCAGGVIGDELPQTSVIEAAASCGPIVRGSEIGKTQRLFLHQRQQRGSERLVACHVSDHNRGGFGQHLVVIEILNVTLFSTHV